MNCPNCKNNILTNHRIEENLSAEVCESCGGYWVSSKNYETWLEAHGEILPEIPASEDSETTIPQFQPARLCPRDKRIMIKYKIGHSIPFTIDRCGDCGGVWFDKDEWETLKSRNLHDELSKIFTDQWHEDISHKETRKTFEKIYAEKFGADDSGHRRKSAKG